MQGVRALIMCMLRTQPQIGMLIADPTTMNIKVETKTNARTRLAARAPMTMSMEVGIPYDLMCSARIYPTLMAPTILCPLRLRNQQANLMQGCLRRGVVALRK